MNRLIQKENRCKECKKLFCCKNCRDLHEVNKHPRLKSDSECDLCYTNLLKLKINNEEKFLCHLVIRHLPLMCILCGNIYGNSFDLQNYNKCDYWNKKRSSSSSSSSSFLSRNKKLPSPIIRTVSCPLNSKRDSPISDTEYHSLQSLTSPPELTRNTSTPMQIGLSNIKSTPQFNNTPKFIFKTPITPTIKENQKYYSDSNIDSESSSSSSSSSNIKIDPSSNSLAYYSAVSQLMNSNNNLTTNVNYDNYSRNLFNGETPSRSILRTSREVYTSVNSERILEVMDENEEQFESGMDMTEVQDNIGRAMSAKKYSYDVLQNNNNKDFEKKVVRFSDQRKPVGDSFSMLEEFYEAECGSPVKETVNNNETDDRMIRENENNSDKENCTGMRKEDSDKSKTRSSNNGDDDDDDDEGELLSPSSSSSRVVMMVVVEKAFDLQTKDLMPLINSSLQKLDRIRDNDDKNLTGSTVSELTAAIQLKTKFSNRNASSGIVCKSVSSIDSYKATSTVDYNYYLSDKNKGNSVNQSSIAINDDYDDDDNVVNNKGGIFSAVAKAVRSAFRALPGTGSARNFSPARSDEESLNVSGMSSENSQQTSLNASGTFSTITTSLSSRPGKRSRDPTNDSIAGVHLREPRSNRNENGASPVAKRPRSWHRIRGRDPIARMRREGSATRGVSSETQHFQQGSLSARDTIIPLPSRAHQSTQTD